MTKCRVPVLWPYRSLPKTSVGYFPSKYPPGVLWYGLVAFHRSSDRWSVWSIWSIPTWWPGSARQGRSTPDLYDLAHVWIICVMYIQHVFRGLDLHYAGPAPPLTAAGEELDDLHHVRSVKSGIYRDGTFTPKRFWRTELLIFWDPTCLCYEVIR